ncbi:MAG: DUF2017 family protein [Actinomycetota bacterium]
MRTFRRASDGRLAVTLLAGEAAMLRMILIEVRKLIGAPDADNVASRRLFPRAYLDPTEEASEAEFQDMVHDDLVDTRVRAFDEIWELLGGGAASDEVVQLRLGPDHEARLLGTLNDTRLALAALTGADQPGGGDGSDVHAQDLLDWLGELVDELVDLLLAETPTAGIE